MQIPDERKYQLAYCKLCQYRDLTVKDGITCALTNKVADFEKECSSMQLDFDVLEDKEIEVHNRILAHIRSNYDLFQLKKENYILPNQAFYSKYYSKKNTHKLKFKSLEHANSLSVVGMILLISFSILAFNVENSNYKVLFGFLAFMSLCFFIIRAIIEFFTPTKDILITDELGFKVDGKRIFWHDIVDFRIIVKRGKRGYFDLIIGTVNDGVHTFNLLYVKIVTDQLLEILNLNRKDYFTRFERHLPEII